MLCTDGYCIWLIPNYKSVPANSVENFRLDVLGPSDHLPAHVHHQGDELHGVVLESCSDDKIVEDSITIKEDYIGHDSEADIGAIRLKPGIVRGFLRLIYCTLQLS